MFHIPAANSSLGQIRRENLGFGHEASGEGTLETQVFGVFSNGHDGHHRKSR